MILLKIHVSGKFLKFMAFPTLNFFPSPPPLTLSVAGQLTNTHSTFSCQIPESTCQPWLPTSYATCQFIPQGLWDHVRVVSPHCQQTPCNTQVEAEPSSDLTTHFRSWLCFCLYTLYFKISLYLSQGKIKIKRLGLIIYLSGNYSQKLYTENLFQKYNFQIVKWAKYQLVIHLFIKKQIRNIPTLSFNN